MLKTIILYKCQNRRHRINKKLNKIYKRTILLFPLLMNQETGGISATIEVDENIKTMRKIWHCWPRDAVFITMEMHEGVHLYSLNIMLWMLR